MSARLPLRPFSTPPKKRVMYLSVTEVRVLDGWLRSVNKAFQVHPNADPNARTHLVGSCLVRADFRDVDIRIPLTAKGYQTLPVDPLDFNMMLSLWGQKVTGLNIDCQVQAPDEWAQYDDQPRNWRGSSR